MPLGLIVEDIARMASDGRCAVKISFDRHDRRIGEIVHRFLQHIKGWRAVEDDVIKDLVGRAQAFIQDIDHGHDVIAAAPGRESGP